MIRRIDRFVRRRGERTAKTAPKLARTRHARVLITISYYDNRALITPGATLSIFIRVTLRNLVNIPNTVPVSTLGRSVKTMLPRYIHAPFDLNASTICLPGEQKRKHGANKGMEATLLPTRISTPIACAYPAAIRG